MKESTMLVCRARLLALSVASLLLFLPLAPIAARASDPRAQAKANLVAGMKRLDRGDNEGALREFEAAFALVPSPKIQFNMGLALQGLDRNVQALEAFDRFLDGATDVPQEKRDQAEKHRRALVAKVVSITISSDVPGIAVAVDSVSRGKTPFARPVYVDAGSHQLVAQKAGLAPVSQTFAAAKGAELTIPIIFASAQKAASISRPPPAPAPPARVAPLITSSSVVRLTPPPSATIPVGPTAMLQSSEARADVAADSSRPAWRRPVKWISLGLAVAAVGVGALETVVAVNKSNDFNALPDNCMDDGNGHIRGGARCEQVNHQQKVATWVAAIGYGLGGAFATTGLILHLTEPRAATGSESASVSCAASGLLWGATCVAHW